jgi:hypothetical protein
MQLRQSGRWYLCDGVDDRSQFSQRRDRCAEFCQVSLMYNLDHHEGPPSQMVWHFGQGWQLQQPSAGHSAVGHRTDPPPPGVQHLTSPRHRKEQCACANHRLRMQPQLKRGDDAERTSTSAEGPEDIRFVIMVDDSCCAICTDDLEPQHIIDGESSRARQPAA